MSRTNFINWFIADSTPRRGYENIDFNIAIHLHLFFIDQLTVFLNRLKKIKYNFDLYISVCSDLDANIVKILFTREIISFLNNIKIEVVPNRGRDVAPWIITFKDDLQRYDLVCHVHSKKSKHFDFGNDWRDYLLDNLITNEAVCDILNIFKNKKDVGIIFPPIFYKVYQIWSNGHTHLEEIDRKNLNLLLQHKNMHIDMKSCFFSAGTMFWYKSYALKDLFELNLTYSDFYEEPIEITGTLAHAIERLPVIIAEANGYKPLCYITKERLIEYYYSNNYLSETNIETSHNVHPTTYQVALKIEKIFRKTGLIYPAKWILKVYRRLFKGLK